VIAALRSGLARLLPARLLGGRGCGQGIAGGGARLALLPEELLFAKAQFGFEFGVALFEFGDALLGLLVHRLPVGGTAERLEAFGQMRTNRARALSRPSGGAGDGRQRVTSARRGPGRRGVSSPAGIQFRDRDAQRRADKDSGNLRFV